MSQRRLSIAFEVCNRECLSVLRVILCLFLFWSKPDHRVWEGEWPKPSTNKHSIIHLLCSHNNRWHYRKRYHLLLPVLTTWCIIWCFHLISLIKIQLQTINRKELTHKHKAHSHNTHSHTYAQQTKRTRKSKNSLIKYEPSISFTLVSQSLPTTHLTFPAIS
jgi:hypothetical protein